MNLNITSAIIQLDFLRKGVFKLEIKTSKLFEKCREGLNAKEEICKKFASKIETVAKDYYNQGIDNDAILSCAKEIFQKYLEHCTEYEEGLNNLYT